MLSSTLSTAFATDALLSAGKFQIRFDENSGALRSMVDTSLERELLDQNTPVPLYQFVLKTKGRTEEHILSSSDASLRFVEREKNRAVLEFTHDEPAITVRVNVAVDEAGARFRLSAANRSDQAIISADFPGFALKQVFGDDPADTAVIFPAGDCDERYWDMPREFAFASAGKKNKPQVTDNNQETGIEAGDFSTAVEPRWPITLSSGYTPDIVQMMAAYDSIGGLYVATHDPQGNSKRFTLKGVSKTGMRLMIEHLQPYRYGAPFSIDYDTVLAPTAGDWTASADLYRTWAKDQPWCSKGTTKNRSDIPNWVKDYPAYLRFRLVNANDPKQKDEPSKMAWFIPWEQVLPMLDSMKKPYEGLIEGAIVHIEDWGLGGQWEGNYRERWPAVMGNENLAKLIAGIKERGYRPGSQPWGWWAILRESNMKYLDEFWPQSTWWETDTDKPKLEKRPQQWHHLCIAGEEGKNIFVDDTSKLAPWGLEYLQIMEVRLGQRMDCFNPNHGHELGRGRWISESLHKNFAAVRAEGKKHTADFCLDKEDSCEFLIAVTDLQWVRNAQGFHMRKNHSDFRERNNVPLYNYIYHEYQPLIDAFVQSAGAHGSHKAMRYAAGTAIALGHITGPLFSGYPGSDTFDQAEKTGTLALFRKGREAARSYAKEYLIYGEVLSSPKCEGPRIQYTSTTRVRGSDELETSTFTLPALVTSAHQAENGDIGLCIVNTAEGTIQTHVPLDLYATLVKSDAHIVIRQDHQVAKSVPLKDIGRSLPLELGAGQIAFVELKHSSYEPDNTQLSNP